MSLKPKRVVLDYETTGLSPYVGARPFIAGIEDFNGKVDLCSSHLPSWSYAKKVIEDPTIEKICHNSKFEIKMSKHTGLKPAGKFHDTMGLSVLINEYQPLKLEELSKTFLGIGHKNEVQTWLKKSKKAFTVEYGRESNYSDIPDELLMPYLEKDLDATLKLFAMWHPHVSTYFPYLYNLETDLAWDIVEMEDRGILIDIPYCERIIPKLRREQKALEKEIYKAAGKVLNLSSSKQVGEVLVELGIADYEVTTNKKGKEVYKVDTSYDTLKLSMEKHPFLNAFITWRTLEKMIGTYLIPFTQKACGNVLHPSFWQYGKNKAIVTGRFSSSDPNMQNIPKGIRGDKEALHKLGNVVRRAILPRPGYAFLFFDTKQIEMVIFTCNTGDKELIQVIRNGGDIYVANAERLFGKRHFAGLNEVGRKKLRYDAKEMSLSLIYGQGATALSLKLKKSLMETRQLKRQYFAGMPKAREFINKCQVELLSKGYIKDIFGRKYHVPTALAYKGVNAACQGPAATVMKRMIIKARQLKQYDVHPVLTIHDELVCEVPIALVDKVAEIGKDLFSEKTLFAAPISIDVEVSYTNWAEKKKWVKEEGTSTR